MTLTLNAGIDKGALEAETALIGAVLLDSTVLDDVCDAVDANDFSSESHRLLWKGIMHLYNNDNPVDLVTVSEMLMKYKRFDDVGGMNYLTKLVNSVPTTANASYYASVVREKGLKRRGVEVAEQIKRLSLEGTFENESQYYAEVERLIESIRPQGGNGMKSLAEFRDDYFEYLNTQDDMILTGFSKFDEWMGGLGRGWLYILAGRPSVGKTAKMLQMAYGIAKQNVGQVLIWSQEMSREQLITRMLSSLTALNPNYIRRKKFDDITKKKIEKAYAEELMNLPISVDDASGVSIDEVRAVARRAKRRHGKIGAIIVDYLTIMDPQQVKGETRSQAIGRITRKAKQIAREIDCPFIMLAQMNREGANDKPKLNHLRDSGEIEQDADVVEFLWHDEQLQEEQRIPITAGKLVTSIIAKGRDVGVAEFHYLFKGWMQRFVEYEVKGDE